MRLARRLVACATALALLPAPARATSESDARLARTPVKQLQVRMLAAEPMHERAERRELQRELRRLAARMRREGLTHLRARGESLRPAPGGEEARSGASRPARTPVPLRAGAVGGPPRANVRCNNTTGDGPTDGQSETSIVRWNDNMVAAWNDGTGFTDLTGQTQGWATSIDGGLTWTDQGKFPIPPAYAATWRWTSDPVLAVNPTTGAFYFAALSDPTGSLSGIGVLKGRFTAGTFAWTTLSVPRTVSASADFLDKEWVAVDPASGQVCLSYTEFLANLSRIVFQSADSSLAAWSGSQVLSPSAEDGLVQGSRPAVGPGGVIYIVYYLIGNIDADYYRICRSVNGGTSFSAPVDAASFYSNFGSGAPAFNREMGIQFPSISVDRSGGVHDGRIYLSWAESMNWYTDYFAGIGTLGPRAESEPDDTPALATALSVGQVGTGSISASSDLYDYWALSLAAGQTVIVDADTVGAGATLTMRMFATDGTTRLTFGQASSADIAAGFHPVWIFTAPVSGTYYLRVAGLSGSGVYRVATGGAVHRTERGRDQRDAFVASSDDGGTTWSTPVRVSNSPVGYDDWLPEVAVAPDGQVYSAWFDWRDAPAATNGGESSTYLARSSDGGTTWAELGATSDARTAWTSVQSNIIPNEGDYLALSTDANGISVAWSDGRGGSPDAYMSFWSLSEASTLPALLSATVTGQRVELAWTVGAPAGFAAELYRRVGASVTWDSLGTLLSSSAGRLQYSDANVEIGQTYGYRLGVIQGATEYFYGQASVTLTGSLALAGAWPNPATPASVIAFTLASGAAATLDLVDITGRRVSSREVGSMGPGPHTVPLSSGGRLRQGVYFVRLKQSGTTLTRRVVVL